MSSSVVCLVELWTAESELNGTKLHQDRTKTNRRQSLKDDFSQGSELLPYGRCCESCKVWREEEVRVPRMHRLERDR